MRQKKRVIGLLAICLLTVGIVSAYAQGGNPLDEVWSTITTIMNDLQNHDDRIIILTARVAELEAECPPAPIGPGYILRHPDVIEVGEEYDIWVYVRNPSLTLEREYTGDFNIPSNPLHNVEVNSLTMTILNPDGDLVLAPWIFYPNGDVLGGWVGTPSEPDPEWDPEWGIPWYVPEIERRFEPIIHPGETKLVYYGGWSAADIPGLWTYTYELNVEFEGTIYDLVKTVYINVVEP